jgi:hypothetical protein
MAHAKLAPSSAVRWMTCPGSMVLSEGLPERKSMPAARGTVAHDYAASVMQGKTPQWVLGDTVHVTTQGDFVAAGTPEAIKVVVDDDMMESVNAYVDSLRAKIEPGDIVLIEQKVPIGKFTGEEGATGTADAIIIKPRTLHVDDYKSGFHLIEPEQNWQGMMYALGALDEYELLQEFDEIVITIHQPEHGPPRSWSTTPAELRRFEVRVGKAALEVKRAEETAMNDYVNEVWAQKFLQTSNDGCRHCPARATCPKLKAEVDTAVAQEFDDLTDDGLGKSMGMIERVEAWAKAVRAEVERRLLARKAVPGFKLVTGRRGARKWVDEEPVKVALGDDAFEKKLISPTTAEKLLKKAKPDVWAQLSAVVTQSDGKPSVAPATDKREEYTPGASADEFEMLIEE